MPQAEIKSIWDGWEKQCYFKTRNAQGETCAVGYLIPESMYNDYIYAEYIDSQLAVVGRYMREQMGIVVDKSLYTFLDWGTVVHANNVLRWTPEQFREIDRLSQIEAAIKPLIESVEEPCLTT